MDAIYRLLELVTVGAWLLGGVILAAIVYLWWLSWRYGPRSAGERLERFLQGEQERGR